ncbi:MAG: DUF222 domain-containing protein [Actinomycetia bacterium]|nr:DUF222 domain-containing protein [Actinomycetes bacterium]
MTTGGLLAELEAAKGSVDLESCSVAVLTDLSRQITIGQRLLTGFATDVTRALQVHAEQGAGPDPEDVLTGGGPRCPDKGGRPDGRSRAEARRTARRAKALNELPALAAAVSAGQVMTEIVDLIVHTLNDLPGDRREAFAATDSTVTARAKRCGLDRFRRWLHSHLDDLDKQAGLQKAERQRAASSLSMGLNPVTGMGWWNSQGDPLRMEEMNRRIRALAHQLAEAPNLAMSDQLQFEAAYLLITRGGIDNGIPAPRPAIGIITDPRGAAAETWGGSPLSPEAVERAACDADRWHILLDPGGLPLDAGRSERHATAVQRLALRTLYPACPLSGEPFSWCEIHHLTPWTEGGQTNLEDLLPLSNDWHHRVHEGGWTITMAADRQLELCRPDGTHDRTVPPPTPITRRPRDGVKGPRAHFSARPPSPPARTGLRADQENRDARGV